MIDRGLEKLLMVIFGVGGIVIFVYVLAQPMLAHERVSAIIIGSMGLFWVLIRVLLLRSMRAKIHVGRDSS